MPELTTHSYSHAHEMLPKFKNFDLNPGISASHLLRWGEVPTWTEGKEFLNILGAVHGPIEDL